MTPETTWPRALPVQPPRRVGRLAWLLRVLCLRAWGRGFGMALLAMLMLLRGAHASPAEGMGGEVQSAIGIQPEPAAGTRFWKGPDGQWQAGKGAGNLHRHRRIGEGDLQQQDAGDLGGGNGRNGVTRGGSIEEQVARSGGGEAFCVQPCEGGGGILLGQRHIKGRAAKGKNKHGLHHGIHQGHGLTVRNPDRHGGRVRRRPRA